MLKRKSLIADDKEHDRLRNIATQLPLYLAQGMSDDMVTPESADFFTEYFQELGKLNLAYVKSPGLNHH